MIGSALSLLPWIAGAFALLALWAGVALTGCLRRGRLLAAGGRGIGLVACAGLATSAATFSGAMHGYYRLNAELPVATLEIRGLRAGAFELRLTEPDGRERRFEILGEEWQIDARVLKWQGSAVVLGLDPLYRLERLSGRYRSVADETAQPRSVHPLGPSRPLDPWDLARSHPRLLPFVDAEWGSAAYMPLEDGARYQLNIGLTGLLVRRLPPLAQVVSQQSVAATAVEPVPLLPRT